MLNDMVLQVERHGLDHTLIWIEGFDAGDILRDGVKLICTFNDGSAEEFVGDLLLDGAPWKVMLNGRKIIGLNLEHHPRKP